MTRNEARAMRRVVAAALRQKDASDWRRRVHGCRRWDDGPCWDVAKAIRCFDDNRGDVVWIDGEGHAVYQLDGWMIDGHRIYISATMPVERIANKGWPSRTLVRLLRESSEQGAGQDG